jgi:hypothetical protein
MGADASDFLLEARRRLPPDLVASPHKFRGYGKPRVDVASGGHRTKEESRHWIILFDFSRRPDASFLS